MSKIADGLQVAADFLSFAKDKILRAEIIIPRRNSGRTTRMLERVREHCEEARKHPEDRRPTVSAAPYLWGYIPAFPRFVPVGSGEGMTMTIHHEDDDVRESLEAVGRVLGHLEEYPDHEESLRNVVLGLRDQPGTLTLGAPYWEEQAHRLGLLREVMLAGDVFRLRLYLNHDAADVLWPIRQNPPPDHVGEWADPVPRRGGDFACEECGALEGSSIDNSCGFPSK